MFDDLLSDDAILTELGRRLADVRLARGVTQAGLAAEAGVSKRTVERLEDGSSVQLASLLRCMRALRMLSRLERLLPETPLNPVDLLKLQKRRRRAGRQKAGSGSWTWGDVE